MLKHKQDAYGTALKAHNKIENNNNYNQHWYGYYCTTSSKSWHGRCTTTIRYRRIRKREQQQALDLNYQNFLEERDFPKQQLGFVSDIIRGQASFAPYNKTQTRPAQQPAPFFQQALGLGAQGLGIAANLGWSPFK